MRKTFLPVEGAKTMIILLLKEFMWRRIPYPIPHGKVSVRPAEEFLFCISLIGPKNYAGKGRVRNTTVGPDRATAALGATGEGRGGKVPYLYQVN